MTREEYILAVLAASGAASFTPVQVQKLFFILDRQVAAQVGGPYFSFRPDNYGPFDSAVYRSLESLADQALIEIESVNDQRRKMYRVTSFGQMYGQKSLDQFDASVSDYIRKLSDWIRGLSFAQLVSSIYAKYPDMKANSIFRD